MSQDILFEFEIGSTLNVTGSVSLDSTFGVDDILGVDSSLMNGVYTLIDGTATTFESLGLGFAKGSCQVFLLQTAKSSSIAPMFKPSFFG